MTSACASVACSGATAGGTGAAAGSDLTSSAATLRLCQQVELWTLCLWTHELGSLELSSKLFSTPRLLQARGFAILKTAVGEYAGDYGFPLPRPVRVRREHLRLRFGMEWRTRRLKSMKILGLGCYASLARE